MLSLLQDECSNMTAITPNQLLIQCTLKFFPFVSCLRFLNQLQLLTMVSLKINLHLVTTLSRSTDTTGQS